MTLVRSLVFSLCAALSVSAAHAAEAADLAAARALYGAASYEEALAKLGPPQENEAAATAVDQLRALCYLALGRGLDAESAVERIVGRDPQYVVPIADVSPKLVTLFNDVRRRMLPSMVRAAYARGKSHVDGERWDLARGEFTLTLALLDDPLLARLRDPLLEDFRQLTEGFLKVHELHLALASAAAMATPAAGATPAGAARGPSTAAGGTERSQPVGATTSPGVTAGDAPAPHRSDGQAAATVTPVNEATSGTASVSSSAAAASRATAAPRTLSDLASAGHDRQSTAPEADVPGPDAAEARGTGPVFSALDQDVTPPVELLRRMPRWSPSDRAQSRQTFQGLLEIVIDERGLVESASLPRSVIPSYDEVLVQAALAWRFVPAKKDGKPVRYRQVLEILLRPTRIE